MTHYSNREISWQQKKPWYFWKTMDPWRLASWIERGDGQTNRITAVRRPKIAENRTETNRIRFRYAISTSAPRCRCGFSYVSPVGVHRTWSFFFVTLFSRRSWRLGLSNYRRIWRRTEPCDVYYYTGWLKKTTSRLKLMYHVKVCNSGRHILYDDAERRPVCRSVQHTLPEVITVFWIIITVKYSLHICNETLLL